MRHQSLLFTSMLILSLTELDARRIVSPFYDDNLNSPCSSRQYYCSGVCIPRSWVCDRDVDCFGGSDETDIACLWRATSIEACSTLKNPPNGRYVITNQHSDWNDASSTLSVECDSGFAPVPATFNFSTCLNTTWTPTLFRCVSSSVTSYVSQMCAIPKDPSNGRYVITNQHEYENHATTKLSIECDPGFVSIPTRLNFSKCLNGIWTPTPPKCYSSSVTCPTLNSTTSTKVRCFLNDKEIENCENPVDGTIAKFYCEAFYEDLELTNNPTRVCRNGSWDLTIPHCQLICGKKRTSMFEDDSGTTKYPWQIGVYNNGHHICGGAILNQLVVISAAHCFTQNTDGSLKSMDNYTVAAGKYYRSYQDPRDELAQYSQIHEVHLPERYKGRVNFFQNDLAVITLAKPLQPSAVVQPVCIDLFNSFEDEQVTLGSKGIVSGWGKTSDSAEYSETLRELELPYVPFKKCFEEVPNDFKIYLTYDKICAGYLGQGISVCSGDGGGPLNFYNLNDTRYYIRGVASVKSTQETNQCDFNQYSTFTLVSSHISLIRRILSHNRIL